MAFRPDFSKQGMQNFFLYHTEKLVLFVCVALMGVFLWMGLQNKPYTEKNPSDLIQLTERANEYIEKDTWSEKLAEHRKGRANAPEILKNRKDVDGGDYMVEAFRGTAAATLQPRNDPAILKPEQLIADVLPATILVNTPDGFAQVNQLSPAPGELVTTAGPGFGGGGFDPENDPEDGGAGDFGDPGPGGFGEGRGGDDPGGRASRRPDPDVATIPELEGVGNQMLEINDATTIGYRAPQDANVTKPFALNVVSVRALVDYKQQAKLFQDTFEDAIGYYPDRDKPIYQFLEIHRRELDPQTGKPMGDDRGQWLDISAEASYQIPGLFPIMHQMPNTPFASAPEVISPENFDPLLTGAIPAFVDYDYTQYVSHPGLKDLKREFPEWEDPNVEQKTMDKNSLKRSLKDGMLGGGSRGRAPAGGNKFGGGRGMGMGMGMGMGAPGEGGGPGGLGAGMGAGMGPGTTTDPDNENYLRRGSEVTPYYEALEEKTPKENYRLVRFFDIWAEEGASYEYRVRLWVGDPNNEDPQMTFASLFAGGMTVRNGFGDPGGSDDEADYDNDNEDFGQDPGAYQDPEGNGEEEPQYVKQTILPSMLRPNVRIRLSATKKNDDGTYTVSTGGDNPQMVDVPKPTLDDVSSQYPYHVYLQHARPSDWSDPVRVDIVVNTTEVVAGKSIKPRQLKVTDAISIDESEPKIEVVASTISPKFQTRIPAKVEVFRGDGFDFFAPAYLMHPVTRQVRVAEHENENWAETPGRYQYEFQTGAVLVDAIFGEELPLPRTEKKRHYTPSEVLVMDKNGNFMLSNELADQARYRNSLFLGDEDRYVGRIRKKKPKKDSPNGGGRGGKFGGGGGSPDGDFGG